MQFEDDCRVRYTRLMQGTENLTSLGGFIREDVERELFRQIPEEIAEVIRKSGGIGIGFWKIREELEYMYIQQSKIDWDGVVLPLEESKEYFHWQLEKTAQILQKRYRNSEKQFWEEWELSDWTKATLQRMPCLYALVLEKSSGSDLEKMESKELAKMPEFSCKPLWIRMLVYETDEYLMSRCFDYEEWKTQKDKVHGGAL